MSLGSFLDEAGSTDGSVKGDFRSRLTDLDDFSYANLYALRELSTDAAAGAKSPREGGDSTPCVGVGPQDRAGSHENEGHSASKRPAPPADAYDSDVFSSVSSSLSSSSEDAHPASFKFVVTPMSKEHSSSEESGSTSV